MPNLTPEANRDFIGVRDYLASALPNPEFDELSAGSKYVPILLLKAGQMMAGFAFSRENITESYERLYGSFKEKYAERRAEWSALDLAFVFCVRAAARGLELFSSEVETDVFFCRKFVIALNGSAGDALARLPFLPLGPVAERSLRPPSAQTFLQQRGIRAPLARALVVHGERSAERIVESCLRGDVGNPVIVARRPSELVPVTSVDTAPIRLEDVRIRNFRAYRKERKLVFGRNVTILYGPNGFGKTSVFDAIDFAATGDVGRLGIGNEERFRKIATHLDSDGRESEVTLGVRVGDSVHRIQRPVSDRKHARLDDLRLDRKEILRYLTGGRGPAADRIENLVSLFRATHLFSQEHQELAKNFARECELSPEVVSRLLAFEDYLNARKKTTDVCRVLRGHVEERSTEIQELRDAVSREEAELEGFARTAQGDVDGSELDDAIASVRARVAAEGMAVVDGGVDLFTLRGWRATLESRVAEVEGRRSGMEQLADDVGELPVIRRKLAEVRREIELRRTRLAARLAEKDRTEQRLSRAEAAVAREGETRRRCRSRLSTMTWVRKVAPDYAALQETVTTATARLGRAQAALATAEGEENRAKERVAEGRRRRAKATERIEAIRSRLKILNGLVNGLRGWTAQRARVEEGLRQQSTVVQALDRLAAQRAEIADRLRASKRKEAEYQREVERIEGEDSDVRALLWKLEGHIDSGVCPLCGEDHGATGALLDAIRKRTKEDVAAPAREGLRTVRRENNELKLRDAALKAEEDQERARLAEVREQCLLDEKENASFVEGLERAGVVRGLEGEGTTQELESLRKAELRDMEEVERELEASRKVEGAGAGALRESRDRIEKSRHAVSRCSRVLGEARSKTEALRNDSRVGGEDLEATEESMKAAELLLRQEMERAEAAYEDAKKMFAEQREILEGIDAEVVSVRSELSFCKGREGTLAETCGRVEAGRRELKLLDDVDREGVIALCRELTRRLAEMEDLRDAVGRVEMALDAATTRAAFRRLRESVRKRREVIDAAKAQREKYVEWLDSFEEVVEVLTAEQETAVQHFTREYGPRTSVIQKRLRSVYGFGEIEILSEDSKIKVRARRGTEN